MKYTCMDLFYFLQLKMTTVCYKLRKLDFFYPQYLPAIYCSLTRQLLSHCHSFERFERS